MRTYAALWMAVCCLAGSAALSAEPDGGSATGSSKVLVGADADSHLTDPGAPLSNARNLFVEVDLAAAAARIRQSSRDLRAAARHAGAEARQSLLNVADELDAVGHRVETRTVKSVEELDRPFARAYHAIALHQVEAGQRQWQMSQRHQAGYRLRAAADNLERLASSTGHRLNATANEAVRESRLMSARLIEGAGYATDEVGKSFESLGKQVEAAGKNVEPVAAKKPGTSVQ